jgi:hypothetical protein
MGWLVALPTLAALFVINKRVNPRSRGRVVVAVITMLVSFGAGCGLAYTFFGQWTATLVSWLGSMLSHFAGSGAGEGLSIALTILFVGVAVSSPRSSSRRCCCWLWAVPCTRPAVTP